ncbi:MAG: methylenetetrahydrofolate reductase C-terminal domain-containing protein [Gammaproteobacteria bacterium]|nr:methylenetetrahydrofolate reductase C-terminal domain-containing protein [Gammaproteobacteria bacterium]
MDAVRHWSVRHARHLQGIYQRFEPFITRLDSLWNCIGYARLEKPVATVERVVKGFLFDCKMCGRCTLSSTGMACPMNCPKRLRNGPCGGVRADGNCEVMPQMRCVWVEAVEGAGRMQDDVAIHTVQLPLDHSLQGGSAWLRAARENVAQRAPA